MPKPNPNAVYRKQNPVLYDLSLPFPHYTPFQNLMRHFLLQTGEYSDTRVSRTFHITIPGLPPNTAECTCFMNPPTGRLNVAYRRSGEGTNTYIDNPNDIPVAGVQILLQPPTAIPATSHLPVGFQQYDGTHKTVVLCIPGSRSSLNAYPATLQGESLVAAGYHVLYYNMRKMDQYALPDTVREELYALRGVVAVMTLPLRTDGRLLVYPSPDAVRQTHSFGQFLPLAEWIAEHAS